MWTIPFTCQPPIRFDFQHELVGVVVCLHNCVRSVHTNFRSRSISLQFVQKINKYCAILCCECVCVHFRSYHNILTLCLLFSFDISMYSALNCETPARIQFSVGAQINNIIAAGCLHSLTFPSLYLSLFISSSSLIFFYRGPIQQCNRTI